MAFPTTITGLNVNIGNIKWITKPFIAGGNVYVFGKGTTTNLLRAFKATDPTSSFSNVGTDVTMTSTQAILGIDAVQSGNEIHVVTIDGATTTEVDLRYHVFNTSSDTWTTSNETILDDYDLVSTAAGAHVAVGIRSDGDVIVLYNGPLVASGGNRERVYYARRESGSWTVDIEVGNGGATSWYAGGVVPGSSDRMHFFFLDDGANDAYQRCLTSANALETFPSAIDTTVNTTQLSALQTGAYYESGGATKIRYPWQDATGLILMSFKCDSADAPTMSKDDGIDGATSMESGEYRAGFAANGTTLWCVYVDSVASDLYTLSNVDDAGWDAPASFQAAVSNGVRTNVYVRNGNNVLAIVANDNSNPTYTEKDLGAAGSSVDIDATASVTWNSKSTAASAFDQDAAASLTWNGTGLYPAAFDSDAVASVTWNGAEVAAGTIEDGDWSAAATASVTWDAAEVTPAAWSSIASSVTGGGQPHGASTASADWNSAAVASLTWNGTATGAGAWDSDAVASLTATGAATASANWNSAAVASLTMVGEEVTGTTSEAAWNASAVATITLTSATIAAASFDAGAVASLTMAGEAVGAAAERNLDGWKPKRIEDTEEEDIMFLMAAIHTYMEQNNVYH